MSSSCGAPSPPVMIPHRAPLWEDFMRLSPLPALEVRFPSGEIVLSPRLLSLLRLDDYRFL